MLENYYEFLKALQIHNKPYLDAEIMEYIINSYLFGEFIDVLLKDVNNMLAAKENKYKNSK